MPPIESGSRRIWGWRPEVNEPTRVVTELKLREGTLPDMVDHTAHWHLDLYQGDAGACVCHAVPNAIRACLSMAGELDPALPARHALYRLCLEYDAAKEGISRDEIHDVGTYVSTPFAVINGDGTRPVGYCAERHDPWDPASAIEPLGLNAIHHAYDQRVSVAEYAVMDSGVSKVDTIKRAVLEHPAVFGILVDNPFQEIYEASDDPMDWTPREISNLTIGGHSMGIGGYTPKGLIIVNSWYGWGNKNRCLLGWRTVIDRMRNIHVVTAARRPTS